MSQPIENISSCDPVWDRVRTEAADIAREEPVMASFVYSAILNHTKFDDAIGFLLAQKIGNAQVGAMPLRELFEEVLEATPEIGNAYRADIVAYFDRDPACNSYVQPLLYFKGFHALQVHRIAHSLWNSGRKSMALYLQNRISDLFSVDIHPAASFGKGVFIDHATGIVVGQTAVVGDDVSMLHDVTLGGTGKEMEDRHPKVRSGVLLGAGAKVLGNIEVGECARVAGGSVVLQPVPAHCTVAGVPAKVMGCAGCDQPSHAMNQIIEEDTQD